MDIYKLTVNLSFCQDGCIFESYNSDKKKAKCNCPPQIQAVNTNLSELEFYKNEMIEEFYEILKNQILKYWNAINYHLI